MNDKAMVEPLNTKAWVLVPVEPTQAMVTAGFMRNVELGGGKRSPEETYRAMLSASPTLPAVDGGEVRAWEHVLTGLVRQKHDKPSVGMAEGDYAPLVRQSALLVAESRVQSLEEALRRIAEKTKTASSAGSLAGLVGLLEIEQIARAALKERGNG